MDMNALRGLFRTTLRLGAGIGACVAVSGCVADPFKEAQIDPTSPVAGEVQKATRAHTAYPSFRDIPPASKDVRAIALYGSDASALETRRDQVTAETADGTWALKASEDFAASARLRAGPELPNAAPGQSEAEAKALRDRATPPPRRR